MPQATPASVLSASEKDILRRVLRGQRDRQIARDLALDPRDVQARVGTISQKLRARDRLELAAMAFRMKLSE